MSIIQRKVIQAGGQEKEARWELDLGAIQGCIGWAGRNPNRLQKELEGIAAERGSGFPDLITTIGRGISPQYPLSSGYAETIRCRGCQEWLVFDNGLRCVSCKTEYNPGNMELLLAYVGKLPRPIAVVDSDGHQTGGGPYFRKMQDRMGDMSRDEAQCFRVYFHTDDRNPTAVKVYFTPPVYAFFTRNWPHSEPYIIVHQDYFNVLDIPVAHVYPRSGEYYKFCLFFSWREQTMQNVMIQRVVLRVSIDIMLADLVAVNKLNQVLHELGKDLHSLYNMIGRRGSSRFEEAYFRAIGRNPRR